MYGSFSTIHASCASAYVLYKLMFIVNGTMLPRGTSISESPLAGTENAEVLIKPREWPVKRNAWSSSTTMAPGLSAFQARGRDAMSKIAQPKNVQEVDRLMDFSDEPRPMW